MPKKSLPAWCRVGATVLIRSAGYGRTIPPTAKRGEITEVTPAGVLYVRPVGVRPDKKPRVGTSRYSVADGEDYAVEREGSFGSRRIVRADTPENRARWSEEMRAFSARMTEQRRRDRKRAIAKAEAEALRARRIAALDHVEQRCRATGMFEDDPKGEAVIELLAFVRGAIRSGDNE